MTEVPAPIRLKKCLKKFLIILGLAIAAVFIPVAHFVLVPLFLILSLVFPWLEYRKKYHFKKDDVECIGCKKTFEVDDCFSEESVRVNCNHCGRQNSLKISV